MQNYLSTISRSVLLSSSILLMTVMSEAQTSTKPYCLNFSVTDCYETREKAETALRAQSSYAGMGDTLEHLKTDYYNGKLEFRYWSKERPIDSVNGPMYRASSSIFGTGKGSCTPPFIDPNPGYADYCMNEDNLINVVQEHLQQNWSAGAVSCVVSDPTVTVQYPATWSVIGDPDKEYSSIQHGTKTMHTAATCSDGSTRGHTWTIRKDSRVYCRAGFRPKPMTTTASTLMTDLICKPHNTAITKIRGPIKQCDSCPANRNPILPATGDKIREEVDFVFAGKKFTRYYHSLRQFRNNPFMGIGWTHTFSDLLDTSEQLLINAEGNYEDFDLVAVGRYRGEKNYDSVLEYVGTGGVRYRLRLPSGEVKEFNNDGRLYRVRNLQNPSSDITLMYGSDGRLLTVTDIKGRQLKFEYNHARLLNVVLPDGKTIGYSYDSRGNLTEVNYGNGQKKKYFYGESGLVGDAEQVHHLTGISHVNGATETRYASFGYDSQGRAVMSTVHGNPEEVTTVSYTSANSATVTTAAGGTNTYTMADGTYRNITNINVDGSGEDSSIYDSSGRISSSTNKNGVVTQFGYPSEYNRVITSAVGTAEQRRREIDRNANNLTTETRVFDNANVLQSKTSWTYNSRGQVLTKKSTDVLNGNTRTSSKTYCEAADVSSGTCPLVGLLISENDPGNGNTIYYTYRQSDDEACVSSPTTCSYRKGDLWKITNSLNHVEEIVRYDGSGRVLSAKDYHGIITEFEYDVRGRLSAITVKGSNGDRLTTMTYTSTNQIKQVNNPDGTYLKYNYDGADRLTSLEDNVGNKIIYTLNGDGKITKEEITDSSGTLRKTLEFTYNSLSQTTAVKDAQSQSGGPITATMTYDSEGNLESVTDALNRLSTNEYDSLGRVTKFTKDAGGALPQEVTQKYNALDKLTKVTDPKNLNTNYLYNGFGDSSKLESKDTGNTTYKYNVLGQLIEKKDANGRTTQYVYDILGRTKIISYDESPTPGLDVNYTYDELPSDCERGEGYSIGRLSKMEDGSGSTSFCYNSFGELVRKVQRTNGKTFVLRWVYKVNGQLEQMIYPDGLSVDYLYNSSGQVSEVGVTSGSSRIVLLKDIMYYPFGPIAGWNYGNGRSLTRTFNLDYKPALIRDVASGGINYTYTFDGVGNLTQLQAPGLIRNYEHDGLNRLAVVKNSNRVKLWEYEYDATGNRTSVTEAVPNGGGFNFVTKNYAYDSGSHHLNYDGVANRTYDSVGNTITLNGMLLSYNTANRLHSVTTAAGSVQYAYNARGERVRRTISSGTDTYFVYNGTSLLGEYSSSGTPLKQMIYLSGIPVGLVTGTSSSEKVYYVQSDALGTPRTIIDPVRNLSVWKNPLESEAFGKMQPLTDPDADGTHFEFNLRFPGQAYDSFTGLVYNYFRDYDPSTGRYVQSDPIGLDGGISTYSYVEANPMNSVDPLGLQSQRKQPVWEELTTPNKIKRFSREMDNALSIIPSYFTLKTNVDLCMGEPCFKIEARLDGIFEEMNSITLFSKIGEKLLQRKVADKHTRDRFILKELHALKYLIGLSEDLKRLDVLIDEAITLIKLADKNGCRVDYELRKLVTDYKHSAFLKKLIEANGLEGRDWPSKQIPHDEVFGY